MLQACVLSLQNVTSSTTFQMLKMVTKSAPPTHLHAPPSQTSPRRRIRTRNRPAMPESHKHPQERPITNRSGRQYPGLRLADRTRLEDCPEQGHGARGAGCLIEIQTRNPKRCRGRGNCSKPGTDVTILRTPFRPPNLPTPAPRSSPAHPTSEAC